MEGTNGVIEGYEEYNGGLKVSTVGTMGVNAGYKWCKRGMNVRCR